MIVCISVGKIGEAAYKVESLNFPIRFHCNAIHSVQLAEKASYKQHFVNIAAW